MPGIFISARTQWTVFFLKDLQGRLSAAGDTGFQMQFVSYQPFKKTGHVRIIVNNENLLFHALSPSRGNQSVKDEPFPSSLLTEISPLCSFTIP